MRLQQILAKVSYFPWQSASPRLPGNAVTTEAFKWDNIEPSESFVYHDCFEEYKCARLRVPMDWTGADAGNNKTVDIAVIKIEATVPITDPDYGGAVVLNPGGPGGSGVSQIFRMGHGIRTILSAGPDADHDTAKKYDIISFDPRGVNNTRPFLSCFPNEAERAIWDLQTQASGVIASNDMAFAIQWNRLRAMAEFCSTRMADIGLGEYMSTPYVARDIIEIVERHGEWRQKEAERLLSSSRSQKRATASERLRYQPGRELVQYWGFSYGTILGATLSAMYPERIKRAVLDGVSDSHDYMRGEWSTNLQDTDLMFYRFGEYCYEGGPKNCAMYHEDGPAVIIQNVGIILSRLTSHPIGIPGNATHGPDIVTYSDLKRYLFQKLYKPLLNFPAAAQLIHDLGNDNASLLHDWKLEGRSKGLATRLPEACTTTDAAYSPSCFPSGPGGLEATAAIMCTDAPDQTNITEAAYYAYAQQLMADSRLFGDSWAAIRIPCTAWRARAKWRYEGDYVVNATAHPLLFVGNTIDPVTPVRNAFLMAKGFNGSVVLQQDSEGHCSSSAPSLCTGKTLRRYFQTGELPQHGAVCEPDLRPFDGSSEVEMPPLPEGETDREMWEALVRMSRS